MGKKAISLTLDSGNLLWLQGQARQSGARSMSEFVDRLVTEARIAKSGPIRPIRSVVGMVEIDESDPFLEKAKEDVRAEFARSIARPLYARERKSAYRPARLKPRRG